MLAITLNEGERVLLFEAGTDKLIGSVEIACVRTARRVKLAIELPLSIRVLREECVEPAPGVEARTRDGRFVAGTGYGGERR